MGDVHYFQRFSQRENVDTNNTLLLLSRVQATDPRLLRDLLTELLSDVPQAADGLQIGVQFSQQKSSGGGSVPDGMLFQSSFRLVIETKRAPAFTLKQLEGHLSAFKTEETKVLLLLAPESVRVSVPKAIEAEVVVVSRSFSDLVAACRAAKLHDVATLREIVDDYEAYCAESDLLSSWKQRVMAVTVGTTIEENIAFRLYYAPIQRGFQRHGYLGLYTQKSVRQIGDIENVVEASRTGKELVVGKSDVAVTDEQKQRIGKAMTAARDHGYAIEKDHRFFLVRKFEETSFRKISSGGLFGKRYFDLHQLLGTEALPELKAVAEKLRASTWE